MLSFVHHLGFDKDAAGLEQRFPNFWDGLERFKKLCEIQFHPENPVQVIAPAKLHHLTSFDVYSIWKIELAVKNVKSNLSPRVWFAVSGTTIAFLCAASHADNYEDNQMGRLAQDRVLDIF